MKGEVRHGEKEAIAEVRNGGGGGGDVIGKV